MKNFGVSIEQNQQFRFDEMYFVHSLEAWFRYCLRGECFYFFVAFRNRKSKSIRTSSPNKSIKDKFSCFMHWHISTTRFYCLCRSQGLWISSEPTAEPPRLSQGHSGKNGPRDPPGLSGEFEELGLSRFTGEVREPGTPGLPGEVG